VIALVVLVLSAFAPYTSVPGLRYEQVAVYGLCALGLARMHWLRSRVDVVGGVVVMSWAAFAAIGIVGLLTPPHNLSGIVPGGAAAGFDNLVLPLAVMGTTWTFTVDSRATLRAVCVALVVAAMANAALAAVNAVVQSSPWFGFGAQGLAVPYDNGWVEAFVVAGACGALLYTAVLGLLVVAWWRRRSRFAGGLVLVVIGASMGLPALTANRVATLAWVLLTLLLFTPTLMPGAPDEPSDRGRHPLWTARTDIAAAGGVTVLRRRPGRRRQ